jgi:hypothetical protein
VRKFWKKSHWKEIKFYLVKPSRVLELLEKERGNTKALQVDLAKLQAQLERERGKEAMLLDKALTGNFSKRTLDAKAEEIKLRVAKLEGEVQEAQGRLAMIEGKTKEAQALQHDIKSLRAEGVKRIFRVLEKLSNKELKAFLKVVIEGRLSIDPQGIPRGDMNLAAGYEFLSRFVTTPA